jgi:hypothetical protein
MLCLPNAKRQQAYINQRHLHTNHQVCMSTPVVIKMQHKSMIKTKCEMTINDPDIAIAITCAV